MLDLKKVPKEQRETTVFFSPNSDYADIWTSDFMVAERFEAGGFHEDLSEQVPYLAHYIIALKNLFSSLLIENDNEF